MFVLAGKTIPMTGRMTSGFFVSGAVGAILMPWLIGGAVGWFGASVMMWIITAGVTVIVGIYGVAHHLGQKTVKRSHTKAKNHA